MEIESNNRVLAIYEDKLVKKLSLPPLFNDMPSRNAIQREKKKTLKYLFNKIRLKKCCSATISKPFPTYHVAYLGNVVTGWAKGEGCIEKPLTTLWRNYIQSSRPDVNMQLTISGGGLKAVTKNHGLTEYWAHRLTTCAAPKEFPRVFCWIYRHEGRKMRHELRCHAALCSSMEVAAQIERELKDFLCQALIDFKKDKLSKQNARLSLINSIQENPSLPRRKILLATGCQNYRPPLEYSKSAPKLSSIEESFAEEDCCDDAIFYRTQQMYKDILKSYEKANFLFEQRYYQQRKRFAGRLTCDNNKNGARRTDSKAEDCDKTNCVNKNAAQKVESNKEDDKKLDIEFKIGGEVLPALKTVEKSPTSPVFTPIIGKTFIDQEQVSLVPVGCETPTDFSSLKVYKKRNLYEGGFFNSENTNQLENVFQVYCSFNSERIEEV